MRKRRVVRVHEALVGLERHERLVGGIAPDLHARDVQHEAHGPRETERREPAANEIRAVRNAREDVERRELRLLVVTCAESLWVRYPRLAIARERG